MSAFLQGTVKWYDPNKGFGFVTGAPQGDVFVHARNIDPERDELIEGQEVSFQVRPSAKGHEAYDVRVTRESSLPPRPRVARQQDSRGDRSFGHQGAPRGARFEKPRFRGPVPNGPINGHVTSVDAAGRFMFVKAERDDYDVFVHSALFAPFGDDLRVGDRVRVTLEEGPKGLRAVTLDLA